MLVSRRELPGRRPMAIALDRLEDPVVFFGPVLCHHTGRSLRAPRPPSGRRARRTLLRFEHRHLDLHLLSVNNDEVFIKFDGLAMDLAVHGLRHGSSSSSSSVPAAFRPSGGSAGRSLIARSHCAIVPTVAGIVAMPDVRRWR